MRCPARHTRRRSRDASPGVDQLLDAVRDRHSGAGDEQAERREHRPHVRLAAVAQRMRVIRAPLRPAICDEQEHLVAGVAPTSVPPRRPSTPSRSAVAAADFASATSALATKAIDHRHVHATKAVRRALLAQTREEIRPRGCWSRPWSRRAGSPRSATPRPAPRAGSRTRSRWGRSASRAPAGPVAYAEVVRALDPGRQPRLVLGLALPVLEALRVRVLEPVLHHLVVDRLHAGFSSSPGGSRAWTPATPRPASG